MIAAGGRHAHRPEEDAAEREFVVQHFLGEEPGEQRAQQERELHEQARRRKGEDGPAGGHAQHPRGDPQRQHREGPRPESCRRRTTMEKLRIVRVGFGTWGKRMAIE
jgi:hypothetical protein